MITGTSSTSGSTDTSASARSALPGGALGKDQFLKMLIAQLQHQDPMNPMQGDQMAAQLAQFSSLEQLQQINSTLTNQTSAYGSVLGAIQAGAAINTIGHTIEAVGNTINIGGDAGAKTVSVMSASAGTGTLHIYDASGKEVGSRALGAVRAGKQTFDLGDAAQDLPDGGYTYSIDVKDKAGNAVEVLTFMTGKVDAISSGPNGIVLEMGGLSVPYSSVVSVK